MKTQSIDTNPKAEKVLIALIRKESFSKKFLKVLSLSQMVINLSKRAIARANKNLSNKQLKLLFIEYHYGKELAERVKKYVEKRPYAKF